MNQRPMSEDDLHAYVDGALERERRAEVAAYLDDHPDVAARIAAYTAQRELLRGALAPIADEPLPPQLNLSRIMENRRRPVRPSWWTAVAALLLVLIGGLSGWVVRDAVQPPGAGLAALAEEASYSFGVYAPDRVRPVEIRATDSEQLVQWVSNRLHQPVKVPDLSNSGYRLMGGRLVATSHGPAAMFMYDDDRGQRLVILTRPMQTDQNRPMTPLSGDNVSGFAWADEGMGYGLVGKATAEQLKPIADDARRQMRAI
jgi:anti-sigma factor RsiW